jgi:hypothetical protein
MERKTMISNPNRRTMEQIIPSKTDYKILRIERNTKLGIPKRRMIEQTITSQNQTIKYKNREEDQD